MRKISLLALFAMFVVVAANECAADCEGAACPPVSSAQAARTVQTGAQILHLQQPTANSPPDYVDYYYKDYSRKVGAIRLETLELQRYESVGLLVVVTIICFAGVVFSFIQLWRATAPNSGGGSAAKPSADQLPTNESPIDQAAANKPATDQPTANKPPTAQPAGNKPIGDQLASSVELSWQKVGVSSSVVGVVVLVISLAFFYLYLTRVYPITSVPIASMVTPETTPSSTPKQATPNPVENQQ